MRTDGQTGTDWLTDRQALFPNTFSYAHCAHYDTVVEIMTEIMIVIIIIIIITIKPMEYEEKGDLIILIVRTH